MQIPPRILVKIYPGSSQGDTGGTRVATSTEVAETRRVSGGIFGVKFRVGMGFGLTGLFFGIFGPKNPAFKPQKMGCSNP